jgi:hypothetical protein
MFQQQSFWPKDVYNPTNNISCWSESSREAIFIKGTDIEQRKVTDISNRDPKANNFQGRRANYRATINFKGRVHQGDISSWVIVIRYVNYIMYAEQCESSYLSANEVSLSVTGLQDFLAKSRPSNLTQYTFTSRCYILIIVPWSDNLLHSITTARCGCSTTSTWNSAHETCWQRLHLAVSRENWKPAGTSLSYWPQSVSAPVHIKPWNSHS